MAREVVSAAGECITAARMRARDGLVMITPIGVIETWECVLTHCTDEVVGSLERGLSPITIRDEVV